jgi:predicted peptidase
MRSRALAFVALLLTAVGCGSSVDWGEHVERRMIAEVSGQQLEYWLYSPPVEHVQDPPLLLFLHGSGERGSDPERVKAHGPPALIGRQPELAGFVVVSPQCPENEWWQSATLAALVDEVLAAQPRIDRERVYVTGLSMGGYGTWSLIVDYPDLFAAAVPICGGGEPNRLNPDQDYEPTFRIASLVGVRDLPIWALHGEDDMVVPVAETILLVEALRALGSEVRLTTYPGVGHDSWTRAYSDSAVYEWLRLQSRSQ